MDYTWHWHSHCKMPSNTGAWILLGLLAGIAALSSAATIQQSGDKTILRNNGHTFLSSGAGQIIRGPDGRTVLIGSNGQRIVVNGDSSEEDNSPEYGTRGHHNNVIINGGSGSSVYHNDGRGFIVGNANEDSYITGDGRSLRVINGAIELNDHGQVYVFPPKAPGVYEKETVPVNGQPALVEYSNGDIVVELADHTVFAKVGDRTFLGDRASFNNRDKLEAEAKNYAERVQQEVLAGLQKTMDDIHRNIQDSLRRVAY
ncbi:uncharacterized protein LOC6530798 [Drosophila yakuba]|uniref:CG18067 protein n=1 Tax=Drosophila yakuba TaxID=7245 RepID=B4PAK2_DROYA|nr:uncharacterized protein LOC6530798 [Drosophila yakuba]EDW91393.2 uncharacterized protein Dyak_GE12120 [Drosophila yakuba]